MRCSHALTVVFFSGLATSAFAQPCGTPWSQSPAAGPSARRHHAVTYDTARGKVVLFGGLNGNTNLGDTWEWTATVPGGGGSWLLRSTTGPSARDHCGLAYDSLRQKTILFGGAAGGNYNNQTWEWDGNTWTQILPAASPPPMDASLMAYDPGRQRTVLVSTLGGTGAFRTWQYDGATWTSFTDATPVASPGYCSMAYDAARSCMVLSTVVFGGYLNDAPAVKERTAVSAWVGREYGSLPTTSTGIAAAFDPVRNQVLFVDNKAYCGKTSIWAWNGGAGTWSVVSSDGPDLAEGRPPVYDIAGGQLLLFGGRPIGGSSDLSQTWLCRSDSRSGPTLSNLGTRGKYLRLGGPSGTMSVLGTGTGTVTYQWRLNQVELFDGGAFSGVHTPTLTVNPTDIVYAGEYDAVVTDSCGVTIRPSTRVTMTCYPNCDGSSSTPTLTAQDFQCFLNTYAAGCMDPTNCYPNCDGSTATPLLTANDFQCYFNQYAIGCF